LTVGPTDPDVEGIAMRMSVLAVILLNAAGLAAGAEGLLPPGRAIEEVVDHYVDARLAKEGVKPAPDADDATLVRRLTLDLVGRVPTAAEVRDYVESTEPDKRARLVDRLLASPGFVRHQADSFETMLMVGVKGSVREYLARAFSDDRHWDQVFRELVVGDESEPARKGASGFLKARAKDTDKLTSDVSSVFFGVNVSCAKCHDHPLVDDWKQDHYFGMKAFLARTFDNGGFVGERGYGSVKFKTTDDEEKQARFMFLTGRVVDVPGSEPTQEARREEKKQLDEAKKKKVAPPAPKVSARAKLVEVALAPGERDFFARAIVNRLWHRMLGRGLVMPLDQMHSENPPSHPELLAWLARDMVEHRYDLRRLIRGLVLSRAYARSSVWEQGEAPAPKLFAVAQVRPLTPTQLATSMWVATTDPASLPEAPGPALDAKLEPLAERARGLSQAISRPGEDYQIGVSESLLMSNSDRLSELLADGGDRLVGRLSKIKDPREQVALALTSVLSRPAEDEEVTLLAEYLARHKDKASEGCHGLVWALVTSAEFRFNH
jgi:hypothetical protein